LSVNENWLRVQDWQHYAIMSSTLQAYSVPRKKVINCVHNVIHACVEQIAKTK